MIRRRLLVVLSLLVAASIGSAQGKKAETGPRRAAARQGREIDKTFDHLSPVERGKLREVLRQSLFDSIPRDAREDIGPAHRAVRLQQLEKRRLTQTAPVSIAERLERAAHRRSAIRELFENSHPTMDTTRRYLTGVPEDSKPLDAPEIRTAQLLLGQLGYYKARPDGSPGPQTRKAVQSFQDASGRRSDGRLNRSTITELFLAASKDYEHMALEIRPEAEKRLRDCIAKTGFADVEQFAVFSELPQTGWISPEFVARLEEDLELWDELASTWEMQVVGLTPEQFFSRSGEVFGFLEDDSTRFALARSKAPELWVLDQQDRVVQRIKGTPAVEQFYEAGRRIAAKHSDKGAFFLYASPAAADVSGTVVLQIGPETITVPRTEFDNFVQSGGGLSKLEEMIGTGTGERRALFVLDRGIFGATAESGATDVASASAMRLAVALRTRYRGVADVFLARDARTALENARKPLPIAKPADLAVYTAPDVTDLGTIDNLRKPLTRAGIRVVDGAAGYAAVPGTNVIIITGHRDQPLSDFLQRLKRDGVLAGKVVAVVSCYEPGVEALQSGLMTGPGRASGVLFYSGVINPIAVQPVMRELSRIVGSQPNSPASLRELWEESVDAALKRADTDLEKQELEKLKKELVDQRSMLWRFARKSAAAA
jgi:hypothetical protein